MYHQRETNPHFVTPPLSPFPSPPLSPPHTQQRPGDLRGPKPLHGTRDPLAPQPDPFTQQQVHQDDAQRPQLHQGNQQSQAQQPQLHRGRHHFGQLGYPQQRPSSLRAPLSRKTKPIAWLIAAFCVLFWIIIIVGGLAILIVYLVYRPRLPKFDITSVTLNAAYLDMNSLLNADITILANFSNPNRKVNVDFSYVVINLYHDHQFIGTRYIEPFTAIRGHATIQFVHMITSQVPFTLQHSKELKRQMEMGRVMFEIKGYFRARSNLGGFLRYSYWLYGHCTITVTGPPTGIMIAKRCTTKR